MVKDTPFERRAYNLGLKAVPNFAEALSVEQIVYYEKHLEELQKAIQRGFILPVYLRRWKHHCISIGPLFGNETLEVLAIMFPGGIGGDAHAVSAMSVPKASPSMFVKGYEVIENGVFKPIFESLGDSREKFSSLFQVGLFCFGHKDVLRAGTGGNFFELEGGFVARTYFDRDLLRVVVMEFSDGHVWSA